MYSFFVRHPRTIAAALLGGLAVGACTKDLATSVTVPLDNSTSAPAFHPASSAPLAAGTYDWSDVTIPPGVTINVTGDVVLRVSGDATIQGAVVGDCVAVKLVADGKLSLKGSVANACSHAPASGAPSLRLIARRGYVVDGGSVKTSGDFEITNDTTVTEASLPAATSSFSRASNATKVPRAQASFARYGDTGVPCDFVFGNFTADPVRQDNGAPGKIGKDGVDGHTWVAACMGDMAVVGNFNVTSQGAGDGGNGMDVDGSAFAKGGKGGTGGKLKILVNGELSFDPGSQTILTSGQGGDGGDANARATADAGNAEAHGGNGGSPGLILINATDGIDIGAPVSLVIGQAGNGGVVFATAKNGNGCAKIYGGDVIAVGGNGGSTPDKMLKSKGAVDGLAFVTVSGGAPGDGGDVTATAGNGAAGQHDCIDGGSGGVQHDTAGRGGDALLKNLVGNGIQRGGKGGDLSMEGGNGGVGYNGCQDTPPGAGGKGGEGLTDIGTAGAGGVAVLPAIAGPPGTRTITTIGNAGKGGDGLPAGAGNTKAAGPGATPGLVVNVGNSFQNSDGGNACPAKPSVGATADPKDASAQTNQPITLPVKVTVMPKNYSGALIVTPGPLPAGLKISPASITLKAGETAANFMLEVNVANAGDYAAPFSVSGAGVAATTQVAVHVTQASSQIGYGIIVREDASTDPDGMEALLAVTRNRHIVVTRIGPAATQQVTITGILVCGLPVVLAGSGPEAYTSDGHFSVSGSVNVNFGPQHGGVQAVIVVMTGVISPDGTIIFSLTAASPSYAFGPIKYSGNGAKG